MLPPGLLVQLVELVFVYPSRLGYRPSRVSTPARRDSQVARKDVSTCVISKSSSPEGWINQRPEHELTKLADAPFWVAERSCQVSLLGA